jgi:UDP-N-acetylmuramoyl-tripeptide--D-alanyl-D-alanine ligase
MTYSPNTASFTRADLVSILGESALHAFPESLIATGVSTDTRTLQAGNIFLALRGERFDGHTLWQEAVSKGASVLVVEYIPENYDGKTPSILVQSTLQTLGALGHFHRKRFHLPVVAVAGAAGKTTTKEMIASVLSEKFTVLKTEGNLNNQIGVPLTLLRLDVAHTAAVIEIGTNEPGEIEILSQMVAPTHGIITNVGKEHLEKLIDLDGVEREETALFRYLEQNGGMAFVNMNDERLRTYWKNPWSAYVMHQSAPTDAYGACSALARQGLISGHFSLTETANVVLTTYHQNESVQAVMRSALGSTGAQNGLAAAAVGYSLGLSAEEVKYGLEAFRPMESEQGYGRMVVQRLEDFGGITLLNDCYNANPTSMMAAFETLEHSTALRKIALLGDMLELGASSDAEHDALMAYVLEADWLHTAILTGKEFGAAYTRIMHNGMLKHGNVAKIVYCTTNAQCALRLDALLQQGDALLLKGSRSMHLEDILPLFITSTTTTSTLR